MAPVVSMSWISLGATVREALLAPTVKSTSMNVHRIPARTMVPAARASTGSNCNCPGGFVGYFCEIDFNECSSDPCQNNGTCSEGINFFNCDCVQGFNGTICDNNIDDCISSPCQNGGTCVDGVNSFSCSCNSSVGDLCERGKCSIFMTISICSLKVQLYMVTGILMDCMLQVGGK